MMRPSGIVLAELVATSIIFRNRTLLQSGKREATKKK